MNKLSRILPLCLAAAFVLGASMQVPAQAQELKIGFLAPRTGIITQLGTDMVNGFQMYLDEHDGKLGGAKVTFIVEDDQGKTDVDVAKAKKLILQDKVDMLVGAVLAPSAYALAPVSTQEKMLYIGTVSTADDHCATPIRQISLHRILHLGTVAADASARAMGLRAGL